MDAQSNQHAVNLMLEHTTVHIVVAGEFSSVVICSGNITNIIAIVELCRTNTVDWLSSAFRPTLTFRRCSTRYEKTECTETSSGK